MSFRATRYAGSEKSLRNHLANKILRDFSASGLEMTCKLRKSCSTAYCLWLGLESRVIGLEFPGKLWGSYAAITQFL